MTTTDETPHGAVDGDALVPRRRVDVRVLLGVLIGLLVVACTLLAFTLTTTTHQVQQASTSPERTMLTEPVAHRQLTARLTTRATIATQNEQGIDCTPTSGEGTGSTGSTVFTRPPELQATVQEGDVVAAVNGRPVIALTGPVAGFRDILPGSRGVDVTQLQQALERLGHSISDDEGTYGRSTQAAVDALYATAGFTPSGATTEDQARLAEAESAVTAAQAQVTQAQQALTAAGRPASQLDTVRAQIALSDARAALAATRSQGNHRRMLQLQVDEAAAEVRRLQSPPDTTAEQAALTTAQAAHKSAAQARDQLAATIGTSVPYCEIVFLPQMPAGVVAAAPSPAGAAAANATGEDTPAEQSAPTGWVTLAPGDLVLRATLTPDDARLLRTGMDVEYGGDAATPLGVGTVASTTPGPGTDTTVIITPETPFAADQRGTNVRVSAATVATDGPVLVVPVAAVSGTADGLAKVTVADGDTLRDVPVTAGLSAEGFVEVTPTQPEGLRAGDHVVVSR